MQMIKVDDGTLVQSATYSANKGQLTLTITCGGTGQASIFFSVASSSGSPTPLDDELYIQAGSQVLYFQRE